MKKNLKSVLWMTVTTLGFIFLIIAMFAVGFRYDTGGTTIYLNNIFNLPRNGYVKDTAGLLTSGLVFSGLAMLLAIIKLIVVASTNSTKDEDEKYWDIALVALVAIATILTIAGASLFIDKSTNSLIKYNVGAGVGLFVLIILPLPMVAIPLVVGKDKN